jgi:proline iminopeptidase
MSPARLLVVAALTLACSGPTAPAPPSSPADAAPAGADDDAAEPDPDAADHDTDADAPSTITPANNLYQATYGDQGRTVVFLHGGPGYNSAVFEATTADILAARYHVVIYDRRGTGRSPAVAGGTTSFTFAQASADLDGVLGDAEAPILLAHSFGGAIALSYLDAHPDFDGKVILVNAPVSYPRSLDTIQANCRKVYEAKGDDTNIGYLDKLATMDPTTAAYAGFVFMHGISCGLYVPSKPTRAAKELVVRSMKHPAAAFFADSKPIPVAGFVERERYTALDLSAQVEAHAARVFAIYGAEDRIISPDDRAFLREALGDHYVEIESAAHNVFIDQQPAFVATLDRIAGSP